MQWPKQNLWSSAMGLKESNGLEGVKWIELNRIGEGYVDEDCGSVIL